MSLSPVPSPSRRVFLGAAAAALFAGVTITLTGCGTEEDSDVAPGDAQGSVSDNHGHKALVTKAQIDAGGEMTLDIRGSADHTHTVVLAADDLVKLKAKQHVMKTSSAASSHSHTVMFF